jgi:hypothetical protein
MLHLRLPATAVVLACLLVSAMASAQQPIVVDVPANHDGTLYQDATGSLANGSGPVLFIGLTGTPSIRRTVLSFDVTGQLPPGAHVLRAELILNVSRAQGNPTMAVTLHRITGDWGEGASVAPGEGGGGAPSQAGDATWLHRFFPVRPGTRRAATSTRWRTRARPCPRPAPVSFGPTTAMNADVQAVGRPSRRQLRLAAARQRRPAARRGASTAVRTRSPRCGRYCG